MRAEIAADGGTAEALSFSDLSWPIDTETDRFRARGRDQKELTLTELWRARENASAAVEADGGGNRRELHSDSC